jgi:hypothetical protein
MLTLQKKYRKDYTGEDVIVERKYDRGVWRDEFEHVPNSVTNNQISNRAAVIGNGPTRKEFQLKNLKNYSGLLGADTLQTYGCNAVHREYTPDFLIANSKRIVEEIANSGYADNNVVYTHVGNTLDYPGKFHIIPHDPYTDAGTTALYLAAFDGHKKIYMLGFDGQSDVGYNYNIYAGTNGYDPTQSTVLDYKWINDKKTLFDLYNDVEFIFISARGVWPIPEVWKYCHNFKQMSHREFVLDASI